MKVLVACEFSGVVREAFRKKGHEAISCDFLPTEIKGAHYVGDVLDILDKGWDLMIAHPPCTYLCNSGVRWLKDSPDRRREMQLAADFFRTLLNANIPKIAIENPIMHKYAINAIGAGRQNQVIHPWMFGHLEQKATCLWLKNLPPLKPTNVVKDEMLNLPYSERAKVHHQPPSKDRWRERSRTFQGIADAMADQWG